ncbi:methylenetetrahydrofolate--tRNA-(uracil(54)-C(5))-methyltransferase (FADH(2)-oxidizing) TrmFO [Desulfovibrio sp. OttesenSCG-928-C14]|nr:methylenetetrahydrofolate--tRNA-(uracil(54)-C(5))-methyltransferase (FADH(2)-oxidizing) TrmFO [Desulfovibrio sp. OttesenSCG-928-C14]
MQYPPIAVIGAGLAGCECALALARRGIPCTLFEMKPGRFSPAHESTDLAELVCSNSLRSNDPSSAVGVLKNEMRALGSLTMRVAEETRVPAGKALAVDRARFSRRITEIIEAEPLITLERREIASLDPAEDTALAPYQIILVTAGPLAGEALSASLMALTGSQLYFYDAIAPIVAGNSLNMEIVFRGSRYGTEKTGKKRKGGVEPEEAQVASGAEADEGDYLNCPMNKEEYEAFYQALLSAQKAPTKDFEEIKHFEGCMPIEALAERGERTLTFGPFKPVGFDDPRTGRRPYALVQLRAENLNGSMYNLVGCQTKLLYSEQARVFRMIPGLENAEFVRYGSMHRNTYVNAPEVLDENLALLPAPGMALPEGKSIYLAGQITGVEGYVESAACGLWLGLGLAARLSGGKLATPPAESALGALLRHLRTPAKSKSGRFQPSNVQYGLMPEPEEKTRKAGRKEVYARRAEAAFAAWLAESGLAGGPGATNPADSALPGAKARDCAPKTPAPEQEGFDA